MFWFILRFTLSATQDDRRPGLRPNFPSAGNAVPCINARDKVAQDGGERLRILQRGQVTCAWNLSKPAAGSPISDQPSFRRWSDGILCSGEGEDWNIDGWKSRSRIGPFAHCDEGLGDSLGGGAIHDTPNGFDEVRALVSGGCSKQVREHLVSEPRYPFASCPLRLSGAFSGGFGGVRTCAGVGENQSGDALRISGVEAECNVPAHG